MPKVIIDGTEYEVREGRNMLEAAIDNGLDLPYFCWHPAMGSVGACRLCAVRVYKDENDAKGKIMMACMTPAREGARISMNDPEAVEFRRYVIEWLMINHPHDCPVCDEGGECHLQDMTTMCGQVYRRFRFKKRTWRNQNLGPLVNHEFNRCIQCYRCVRFYCDLAGGKDLSVFGSRDRLYLGRADDGVLKSEFSGNLVEVCPTGVFTDKTYGNHYTRKWDLENAPSVCPHCSLGCNTIPGARNGMLRRITSRFNAEVNGYFICDRGRFGYGFVNGENRIRTVKGADSISSAITRCKEILKSAKGVVGIGSPRASIESNYALKTLVGEANFSCGLSAFDKQGIDFALKALREGRARTPSLAQVEQADVIVVLGADPTNEAPMLDFAIRQAMRKAPLDVARKLKIEDWDANAVKNALQDAKGKLYTANPWPIKLEEIAVKSLHLAPHEIVDFSLDSEILAELQEAHQPLVVTSVSAGIEIIQAAAKLADSVCMAGKDCWLSIIVPEANSMGAAMLGGIDVDEALSRVNSGEADTIIVLENDLYRRAKTDLVDRAFAEAQNVIALDCISTNTTNQANIVLPTPTLVEDNGTFVNNEDRAQRFYSVYVPDFEVCAAWSILQQMRDGRVWESFEAVLAEIANNYPDLADIAKAGVSADWRSEAGQKIPRMPHRYSGRTAINANQTVFEPRSPADPNTPFAFSMEGDQNPPPGPLVQRFWYPGWNSQSAINKFQIEVGGPLHGGNAGERLIEPLGGEIESSRPERAKADGIWIIPRPHIFGSEELSRLAPWLAEITPAAVISANSETAGKLGMVEGEIFEIKEIGISLPVRIDDGIAPDVICVPAGYDETLGITEPVKL